MDAIARVCNVSSCFRSNDSVCKNSGLYVKNSERQTAFVIRNQAKIKTIVCSTKLNYSMNVSNRPKTNKKVRNITHHVMKSNTHLLRERTYSQNTFTCFPITPHHDLLLNYLLSRCFSPIFTLFYSSAHFPQKR